MGTMSSWFGSWVDPTAPGSRVGGNSPGAGGDPSYNPDPTVVGPQNTFNGDQAGSSPTSTTSSLLGGNASNNPRNPGSAPSGGSSAWGGPTSDIRPSTFTATPTTATSLGGPGWQSGTFGSSGGPLAPSTGNTGTAGSTTPVFGSGLANTTAAGPSNAMLPPPSTSPPLASTSTPLTASSSGAASGTGNSTASIPLDNPYGSTPFAANPGYTGPYGPGGYGPQTLATQSTAQQIATQYGGAVINNPAAGILGSPASPFSINQAQYMIQMPNGSIVDPAKIAAIYANAGPTGLTAYDQAQVQDVLNGSDGSALAAFRGLNQALPTGTPVNSTNQPNIGGYTPSPVVQQQWQAQGSTPGIPLRAGISTDLFQNPFNLGTQYSTSQTWGGNTDGAGPTASPTPTPTPTPSQQSGPTLDSNTLQQVLQFLATYGGLGAGAGNPQGVNQNGPLSQYISQILSGLGQSQDLYTRRRVSQVP